MYHVTINIDKIVRSRRRTIALEISRDADLIVRAPHRASMNFIEKVVFEKRFWVKEKQALVRDKFKNLVPKKFVNGEWFMYLGERYQLEVVETLDTAIAFNGAFQISHNNLNAAKNIIIAWYKEQAYQKIEERANWYASKSGLRYSKIRISDAQRRWGSCSSKGNLNFSWRLIMAPSEAIDYVVVHEMAHLEEKNHAKRFWDKVKIMMPDYAQHRKWLKENTHLLDI